MIEELTKRIKVADTREKKVNKLLKVEEKEIDELKKENVAVTEQLIQIQTEFAHFKSKVNSEAKSDQSKKKKETTRN